VADRLMAAMLAGIGSDDDASLLLVRAGDVPAVPAQSSVRAGSMRLPPDRSAAPQGRRFLRERCADWHVGAGVATAELLAGELMANAIVHAGTPFELAFRLDGDVLRVEVRDSDGHRPVLRHAAPTATGGRGLALVEALADRGGVDRTDDRGKAVWFEVAIQ
jgi:anti-sigma regulatory factor (Ser/Thr protein kinase)